MKTSIVLFFD